MVKPKLKVMKQTVPAKPRWSSSTASSFMLPKVAPFTSLGQFRGWNVIKMSDYVMTWLKETYEEGANYTIFTPNRLQWEQHIGVTDEVMFMLRIKYGEPM